MTGRQKIACLTPRRARDIRRGRHGTLRMEIGGMENADMRLYRTPKASLIVGSVVSGCLIVVSILFFGMSVSHYLGIQRKDAYEPLGIDVDLSVPGITKASFEIPYEGWETYLALTIGGPPIPQDDLNELQGEVRIVDERGVPFLVSPLQRHLRRDRLPLIVGPKSLGRGRYDLEINVVTPASALAERHQVLSARRAPYPEELILPFLQFFFGAFCTAIATLCAVLVIRSYRRKKAFVEFANELASGSNAGEFAEEGGSQQRGEGDQV